MPIKGTGPATEYSEIDRYEDGVGWIAHPDEGMERASHAIEVDGDVYLIDPLSIPDLADYVAGFGEIAGIVVLLDRHSRDAVELARQFEVPIHLPATVDLDLPNDIAVSRHDRTLAETGFDIIEVVNWPGWRETALFDGETLIVAEAVGTADFFVPGEHVLGVQPVLRLTPPSALRGLNPERILVGHGSGIHENARIELADALDRSRRTAPQAWFEMLRGLVSS